MGKFKLDLRTDTHHCSTLTHLDLVIAPSSITTESSFTSISGTNVKPKIVMSTRTWLPQHHLRKLWKPARARCPSSNSRQMFYRRQPTQGGENHYGSIQRVRQGLHGQQKHEGFAKRVYQGLRDQQGLGGQQAYENIWDDTTASRSNDAKKGDGNNTPENTQSSGSIAISTLDLDDMKQNIGTVGIEIGPTETTHHVYRPRD